MRGRLEPIDDSGFSPLQIFFDKMVWDHEFFETGNGIMPGEQLLQEYRSIRQGTCFDGAWQWPKLLVPFYAWGRRCTPISTVNERWSSLRIVKAFSLGKGISF